MLMRKKKTRKKQSETTPTPKDRPDIGSGWVPGVSDGSWLLPDWVREQRIEQDTGGVWRPVQRN